MIVGQIVDCTSKNLTSSLIRQVDLIHEKNLQCVDHLVSVLPGNCSLFTKLVNNLSRSKAKIDTHYRRMFEPFSGIARYIEDKSFHCILGFDVAPKWKRLVICSNLNPFVASAQDAFYTAADQTRGFCTGVKQMQMEASQI